jgi:hypothetical protein
MGPSTAQAQGFKKRLAHPTGALESDKRRDFDMQIDLGLARTLGHPRSCRNRQTIESPIDSLAYLVVWNGLRHQIPFWFE